jgi:hypothetical protein
MEHTYTVRHSFEYREILNEVMQEIAESEHGKMDFKGNIYTMVPLRLKTLRKHFGTKIELSTDILENTDEKVLMRASIYLLSDTYPNEKYKLSDGYAEEKRGATFINQTSCIENCQTSAWGRALAGLGLMGDSSIASAEELATAIINQPPKKTKTITKEKNDVFAN